MATRNLTVAEVIDQALIAAVRIASGMGPVGHHELSAVVTSFRTALLSVATYDAANPPTVEEPDPEPVEPEGAGEVVTAEAPAAGVEAENLFA
jgi:hypothetical protein